MSCDWIFACLLTCMLASIHVSMDWFLWCVFAVLEGTASVCVLACVHACVQARFSACFCGSSVS